MHLIEFGGDGAGALNRLVGQPILSIRLGKPEGNRVFYAEMESEDGGITAFTSDLYEASEFDELNHLVINKKNSNSENLKKYDISKYFSNSYKLYKIVGKDEEIHLEFGVLIESEMASILLISGAFPYSMHVFFPDFSLGIIRNNLPNLGIFFEEFGKFELR